MASSYLYHDWTETGQEDGGVYLCHALPLLLPVMSPLLPECLNLSLPFPSGIPVWSQMERYPRNLEPRGRTRRDRIASSWRNAEVSNKESGQPIYVLKHSVQKAIQQAVPRRQMPINWLKSTLKSENTVRISVAFLLEFWQDLVQIQRPFWTEFELT